VEFVKSLGVELVLDAVVGKIDTVDELLASATMPCSWVRGRVTDVPGRPGRKFVRCLFRQ